MTPQEAQRIVNAVLDELSGRGGFDIIEQVMDDTKTYQEMYTSLVSVVIETFDDDRSDPQRSRFYP